MKIAIDIIVSVMLIAAGYCAACNVLNGKKCYSREIRVWSLSRNRMIYLSGAMAVCAVLIVVFQVIYEMTPVLQVKLLSLVFILFPTAAVDFRIQKIPNAFMLAGLVIRGLIYIVEIVQSKDNAFQVLKDNLVGALAIGGFFLILLLVFKNSIGMGDVKLFAVMGLYQGLWGAINSVFFSLMVSFVVSMLLLITRKKGRRDTISFAPSILVGTIVSICLSGM